MQLWRSCLVGFVLLIVHGIEANANINGLVYFTCGSEQPGVDGAIVTLRASNGTILNQITTNSTGTFEFYQLSEGSYTIAVTPSAEFTMILNQMVVQITAIDTQIPVEYPVQGNIQLTVPPDATVPCGFSCSNNQCATATAYSYCPNETPTITSSNVIQGNCPTTITRTWTAHGSYSATTSKIQKITVVDDTAPTLTVPASVTLECGTPITTRTTGTATARDNCSASATITYSDQTSGNSCQSVISRTWSASDHCNNVAYGNQVITVVDNQAPTILSFPYDMSTSCTNADPP
jgi:hypothetical protein